MAQEYKVTVFEDQTVCKNMKGEYHLEDGPAIEWSNGHKERPGEDGPAIEWSNGHKERPGEDGPAIEWSNGHKDWHVNGQELTEEEFKQKVNPVKELTVEEISKLLGYDVKIVKS